MLPVILLGGLNVVRALGLAGIPVIVATQDRRGPATASRWCSGVIELPPLGDRDAVVETLLRAGRSLGARVPLFYDNDDRLALVERTGLPVPRRIEWAALDAHRGPVLVKPRTRTAWDNSAIRLKLFGGAGKARVFASGREARADALVAQLADRLQF